MRLLRIIIIIITFFFNMVCPIMYFILSFNVCSNFSEYMLPLWIKYISYTCVWRASQLKVGLTAFEKSQGSWVNLLNSISCVGDMLHLAAVSPQRTRNWNSTCPIHWIMSKKRTKDVPFLLQKITSIMVDACIYLLIVAKMAQIQLAYSQDAVCYFIWNIPNYIRTISG